MVMPQLSESWPFDLVEILWDDAGTSSGWENETAIKPEEELVTTIGFLVKKTKKCFIVAASSYYNEVDEEYCFNARIQIPKGMVKKVKVLVPKNTDPGIDLAVLVAPGGNA
jgi:hypothetical protein